MFPQNLLHLYLLRYTGAYCLNYDVYQLEARLRSLEGKELGHVAGSAKGKPKIEAYDKDRKKSIGGLITAAKV